MEIGNKIMELRKKSGLSQEELAEKVGVARQTISKWELGETSPDLKQAKELSKIFKISIDELVDNDIKEVILKKTSNTEKLAGLIIKILKVLGIAFLVFLVIDILAFIFFMFNHKTMDERVDGTVSIICTLHDKNYSYQFDYEKESSQIINSGGDGYLANITDITKYDDVHQALDVIEEYAKNHDGNCTISE